MSEPPDHVADPVPVSAGELARQLGDLLPLVDDVPPASFDLVDAVRALVEATVMTDVTPEERVAVADAVRELTARLNTVRRPAPYVLVRHANGRPEHLTQAGSGRLNPQAPPMIFVDMPPPAPADSPPVPVEVHATCTLTNAHAGSTGRAHGSLVAALLDEAVGHAVNASGAGGMTVNLSIDFRRPTPVGEPLLVTGRYDGGEGRKSFASGEIRHAGEITAEARALFVRPR